MRETTKGDFFRAAFIAALIGGTALALIMVIPPAATGGVNLWPATQFAAYPFLRGQVFKPGFEMGPMVLGTLMHFVIAYLWALAFTFLVRNRTRVQTLLLSVPAGVVVWVVMHQIILRLVGAGEVLRALNPWVGILQHVVFMGAISATLVLMQPQNWRFRRTRRALAA